MTVAPASIAPPAVRPPLGGLIPVSNVVDASDPHVMFGVQYQSFLCESGGYTEGCVTAPSGVPVDLPKVFGGSHIVDGVPVTVYAGVECDLFDAPYSEQALDRLLGAEDRLVSNAFFQGLVLPHWNAGDVPILVEDEVCGDLVIEAIAQLEQYAAENYAGLPVIHMSRYTATYAISRDVVVPNLDGTLQTLQGTPVANAAGYPDCVMWVTGQVNMWRTPTATHTAPNLSTNTSVALAERTYVVANDCLLAIAGPLEVPDSLVVSVPSPIGVTVDEPTVYPTYVTNTGGPVDATQYIRLHSADGALAPEDVIFEVSDGAGGWTQIVWTQDGNDLVYSSSHPIEAGAKLTSEVRITVTRDLDDLQGTTLITGDFGAVLAEETYQFIVSAGTGPVVPVPTITAVDPASGDIAGGTVVTITGTGFLEGA